MTGDEADALRKVALFNPVITHYRVDLFNAVHDVLCGGLTLFALPAAAESGMAGGLHRLAPPMQTSRTWRIGPVWFVPRTFRAIASRRWDVIVLSWNVRQVELLPALLLARLLQVPVVLWGHGLGHSGSRAALVVRRGQARLATAILTYGDAGARDVASLAPGLAVAVLQNTTGRPSPAPDDGLRLVHRRVAFLGRLDRRKHLERLLGAIDELRRTGFYLRLEIIGDGPERASLEAESAAAGLDDAIIWHGRVIEWADIRALLQRCDLVIQPSWAGLAVVDAFAAARGAVVVDDPRLNPPEADLVVDGETGFRYGSPTVAGLAACLRRAYEKPERLLAISDACGELYRSRLSVEAAATAFGDLIDDVTVPGRWSFRSQHPCRRTAGQR
jgi:glycosyltransferase involved in cell wall biosynthesis